MTFTRFPMRAHTAGSLALPAAPPLPVGRVICAAHLQRGITIFRPHVARPLVRVLRRVAKGIAFSARRLEEAVFGRWRPKNSSLPQAIIARGPPESKS